MVSFGMLRIVRGRDMRCACKVGHDSLAITRKVEKRLLEVQSFKSPNLPRKLWDGIRVHPEL